MFARIWYAKLENPSPPFNLISCKSIKRNEMSKRKLVKYFKQSFVNNLSNVEWMLIDESVHEKATYFTFNLKSCSRQLVKKRFIQNSS